MFPYYQKISSREFRLPQDDVQGEIAPRIGEGFIRKNIHILDSTKRFVLSKRHPTALWLQGAYPLDSRESACNARSGSAIAKLGYQSNGSKRHISKYERYLIIRSRPNANKMRTLIKRLSIEIVKVTLAYLASFNF